MTLATPLARALEQTTIRGLMRGQPNGAFWDAAADKALAALRADPETLAALAEALRGGQVYDSNGTDVTAERVADALFGAKR